MNILKHFAFNFSDVKTAGRCSNILIDSFFTCSFVHSFQFVNIYQIFSKGIGHQEKKISIKKNWNLQKQRTEISSNQLKSSAINR